MKHYYCTYFDRNYFVKAMGMINSLLTHEQHPFEIYAVCLDELTRIFLKKLNYPFLHLIPLHDIEYHDQALINARGNRSLIEYYWTLTPSVILKILDNNPHIDVLTYLDADLYFYSSPDPIWNELGNYSIMIHEHRFSPEQKASEMFGKYNVGLLCFRNDQRARTVLHWWRNRCNEWCYARLEKDRYGDQLYLNQFPIRFEGVNVLKHIGAGVGPWNHIQYHFTKDQNNQVFVDGYPLVFYHFHSLIFVQTGLIIPSKYIKNPFTLDILSYCFIPYVDKLWQHIQEIRSIHPDFDCGLSNKNMITADRMFIAHKSIRSKIEQSNLPHEYIPMNGNWDCYATSQLRKKQFISHQKLTEETLPVPTGKKQTPPDIILDQAEQELQKGNTNIAIQMLMRIIHKWPNYYLAYNDLGIIHWKSGDKKYAFDYLKHAYELNPFDAKIVKNLVKMLLNLSETKAADNIISHYLERFPADLEMRELRYKIVKPVMLNLGCGKNFHKDWINIDIKSSGPDVIAHNLFSGIPYDNNSVDVVYHSHVLEHMHKQFAPDFLKECFRVLKKGGIIRVVIPDLERIVREYINHLENALNGDEDAAKRYEWIMLELYDQTVRNQVGGEMLEYWKQNPMPAESYIYERCGHEVSNAVELIRRHNVLPNPNKDIFIQAMQQPSNQLLMQMARFRISGEVHQWMYDRYSLKCLLQKTGFSDIHVCKANESNIADFSDYCLDTDNLGNIRKPDSLFMEARKF
jgi:predicted SAM-dependent methyltransferase